jgi:ATP-dependent Lon protease
MSAYHYEWRNLSLSINSTDTTRELLPLLPLRALTAYPNMLLRLDVGRDKSITALDAAVQADQRVFAVSQRDATLDAPHLEDLHAMGTVVVIKQSIRMPDGTLRVLVEGESRALLLGVQEQGEMLAGEIKRVGSFKKRSSVELVARVRALKQVLSAYAAERGDISNEFLQAAQGDEDPDTLCDLIAANLPLDVGDKQQLLETRDVSRRTSSLISILNREIEVLRVEKQIHARVRESIDQHQKEYYLQEQLRVIHEELGDDSLQERAQLEKKLSQSKMGGEARDRVERELRRLEHLGESSPEASVSRNYVETMLDLPWGITTGKPIKVTKARKVLEKDHYALTKVKQRVLEYLAVHGLKGDLKGPILCLVGPPGVGKTSIARCVARALDRKFVRLSLGGLRDEAEIRGHRRTYIGAMPGRIISSIRQCGASDPVFLLDEIDKLASDFRGDPASALLEALDPEQNALFSDHYLEAPFDLSNVLFLATANTLDTIPEALLDRLEIIEVESYTQEEKLEIARRHLWPRQLKAHGLEKAYVRLTDKALVRIIDGYTREAGVRSLERELAAVCRKAAMRRMEEGATGQIVIGVERVKEYLGAPRFLRMAVLKAPETGIVNALAWTPAGGETMPVEAVAMPGNGSVDLTGRLGDVMKESARTALSYIRSKTDTLGINTSFYKEHDLHIHVPEGATSKDGPSAGVALTCAMVSALTGKPARQDVAMTGEVTLRGRVLPIGGVKEKLLAAHRMGIGTVLLPEDNARDLNDLPPDILKKLHVELVRDVDQAIKYVIKG